jgi:Ni,Fe-hydrogenase I cytochrome b subunit
MPRPHGFLDWTGLLGVAVFTPLVLSFLMSISGFTQLISSDQGGFIRAYVFMLCASLCGAFAKPILL